jgi:hypothetical protein
MGAIRETSTGQVRILEPNHVVGRVPAPACALTLNEPYVSSVHAELRWTGEKWDLKDLGSRNGTYLDGRRIEPSVTHKIARGSKIAFGRVEQEWEVTDDSAPPVMAVPLGGGEPVVLEGDLLALPSSDDPRATIYPTTDGSWVLEAVDEAPVALVHMQTFEAVGRLWRFCCPDMSQATLVPSRASLEFGRDLPSLQQREVQNLCLVLSVTRDEEYVHLRVSCGDREFDMGARRHNYLLLTLARRRLAEAAEGLPESSCGWIDQDEYAHDPTMMAPHLNVDVFRIRQQFAKVGVIDAARIVERRPGQLRVGTGRITLLTL